MTSISGPARARLAAQNWPEIGQRLRAVLEFRLRRLPASVDTEQLRLELDLLLWEAERSFDGAGNRRGYASQRWEWCYYEFLRSTDARGLACARRVAALVKAGEPIPPAWLAHVPYPEPVPTETEPLPFLETVPGVDVYAALLLAVDVERELGQIAPRLARVLRLRFWDGLRLREVARVLQVSDSRVFQLQAQAFAALRERLEER